MIVYLEIPYKDLEYAKRLGVQFDMDKKMWYIKNHDTMKIKQLEPFLQLFGKWLASKMKKIKKTKFKNRHHVVTQPRTPRKKEHRR